MNLTFDEYKKRQDEAAERKRDEASGDAKVKFRAMLRDAAAAENLTGDENWDLFLTWVSGAMGPMKEAIAGYHDRLGNPTVSAYEDLVKLKIGLANTAGMLTALEWVSELPVQLKSGAQEVREQLKIMREAEDE